MSIPVVLASALLLLQQSVSAPGATIRGRVFDPDGRPMPNVTIVPLLADGDRDVFTVTAGHSDDEGRFTVSRVPAGTIVVRVTLQPVRKTSTRDPSDSGTRAPAIQAQPPVFFPGVIDRKDAWEIAIKPGEIIELDIHVPPVFVASIKTVVSGPDGYNLDQVRVMRPASNTIRNVRINEDGVGYADALREGRYAVAARGRSGGRSLAAWQIVDVVSGEVAVTLTLEPTARVNGRIVADGGTLPALGGGVRVVAAWTEAGVELDPLAADQALATVDGSFTIDGLFGTRIFRVSGLPPDWIVASVQHGRADVTDVGAQLAAGSDNEITIAIRQR